MIILIIDFEVGSVQCSGEMVTIKLVWSLELQFNLRPAVDWTMDPRTDYIAAKYARFRAWNEGPSEGSKGTRPKNEKKTWSKMA